MMPYYGIPVNQTKENVGFAFNKEIITDILRNRLGYDGVVCTDWSILTDKEMFGIKLFNSTGWGVENLSPEEKIVKAIDAGIDQFGGEQIPSSIVNLVNEGRLNEQRIDESVRRLLRVKFQLGLFDDAHNDKNDTTPITTAANQRLGKETQGRSMVLLENKQNTLPLKRGLKLYVENLPVELASRYGTIVNSPKDADFAIIRIQTPYQKIGDGMAASFFHHGDLDFKGEEKKHLLNLLSEVPTIVDIYLDRPAVIPDIAKNSRALLANFGADDDVLLDVIFGTIRPEGILPIEMPSSMDNVRGQLSDVPYDSKEPLYPFGYGLQFTN